MKIEIILTGPQACGKTRLAKKLEAFLRAEPLAAGAEVKCVSLFHERDRERVAEFAFGGAQPRRLFREDHHG